MELKVPLEGSSTILSFFPDDTIETVRQHVALAKQTHPDRLFIQVQVELPKDYYSSNPKRWMDLFYRLSHGKNAIRADVLDAYVSHVRPGTGVAARDVSREDWHSVEDFVHPLCHPPGPFKEWRILGVSEDKSMVLPIPPKDTPIPAAYSPAPSRQLLFETMHPEEVHAFMAVEVDPAAASDVIRQVYFPFFQASTPANIETLRIPLKAAHEQITSLMKLKSPEPTHASILRAKWYIPLISTKFTAPRVRFEQIFYGLTVSPTTPVVSYFTSKGEITRHKFYVEDPKTKDPMLNVPMWKAWMNGTQPQRRLPTLLFYRGKNRSSFDRIAITNKDITVSTWRGKDSKESLPELQEDMLRWMKTLDAVMPFLVETDIGVSRWVLNDLTVVASYAKEISEFDMRRFGCLQSVFSYQDNAFRLLRADRETDIPPEVLRAYTILQEDGSLETEMGITAAEAATLSEKVQALEADENFNFEKATGSYPVVSFSSKDVMVKFVKNMDRVLDYASMLRYVLTSDKEEVNALCPRRLEVVEASAGVANTVQVEDEFDLGDVFAEEIAAAAAAEPAPSNAAAAPAAVVSAMRVKKSGPISTHNYFNNRILQIDRDLVDDEYSKKCEKLTQVVILTAEDQERIPEAYNYSTAPANEKMTVAKGIAICPQYWCMRDEIPLSEAQLVTDDDNAQCCPVCKGKVRITDKEDPREFTVIKRKGDYKYPDFKEPSAKTTSKKKVPCCYRKPAATTAVLPKGGPPQDDYYVLSAGVIPEFRIAYLPPELTRRIHVKTDYAKTCPSNRIEASATDMFRIGLGHARDTLPTLLTGKETRIPSPAAGKEQVLQCSFFRTWKDLGDGDTLIERIVDGIDRAFTAKTMSALDEIEYVSMVMDCRVMRINLATNTMSCGFWADKTSARSRTIVLLDTDVLGKVSRRAGNVGSKFDFVVDVNKFDPKSKSTLQSLHTASCLSSTPGFDDAVKELMAKNVSNYQVILDPFKRVQAIFVPEQVVLPIHPLNMDVPEGVAVRSGYADVKDEELPTNETLSNFLKDTRHAGFKRSEILQGSDGTYSELLLESGFRAPFRPEAGEQEDAKEVLQTVRKHTEEALVHAAPNKEDLRLASDITYSSEVFEFLMFSLSKDIQETDHEELRAAVQTPGPNLYKDLAGWLSREAYWDEVNEPVQFVNKVRTPCGQMTNADTCKKSTLCGWHQDTCKIKVQSVVDRAQVLKRMTKVLKENSKQRALVLDGRLSPFFSTILYLEMPHELITSDV
jgi:hypothetical protein